MTYQRYKKKVNWSCGREVVGIASFESFEVKNSEDQSAGRDTGGARDVGRRIHMETTERATALRHGPEVTRDLWKHNTT